MAAGLPSIPVALRPSSMQVYVPKASELGGAYEDAVAIDAVRFVRSDALSKNDYHLNDGAKGLVFIDATSPGAFRLPLGTLVEIDGERMEVSRCSQYEAFGGAVHHWEVEVS